MKQTWGAAVALLFDLEDSTAANEKPAAREAIARVLRAEGLENVFAQIG